MTRRMHLTDKLAGFIVKVFAVRKALPPAGDFQGWPYTLIETTPTKRIKSKRLS
jgi:hypothetical protein